MANMNNRLPNDLTTPNMIVEIDDLLNSTLEGFEKSTYLYHMDAHSSRSVAGDTASGSMNSRAEVKASNISMVIATGDYATTLKNNMFNGVAFKKITVRRLMSIGDSNVVGEQWEYDNCLITDFKNNYKGNMELINFQFRFQTETHTFNRYGHDGIKQGQNVSSFDFSRGKSG